MRQTEEATGGKVIRTAIVWPRHQAASRRCVLGVHRALDADGRYGGMAAFRTQPRHGRHGQRGQRQLARRAPPGRLVGADPGERGSRDGVDLQRRSRTQASPVPAARRRHPADIAVAEGGRGTGRGFPGPGTVERCRRQAQELSRFARDGPRKEASGADRRGACPPESIDGAGRRHVCPLRPQPCRALRRASPGGRSRGGGNRSNRARSSAWRLCRRGIVRHSLFLVDHILHFEAAAQGSVRCQTGGRGRPDRHAGGWRNQRDGALAAGAGSHDGQPAIAAGRNVSRRAHRVGDQRADRPGQPGPVAAHGGRRPARWKKRPARWRN